MQFCKFTKKLSFIFWNIQNKEIFVDKNTCIKNKQMFFFIPAACPINNFYNPLFI